MSESAKEVLQEIDEAQEALSDAEEDVVVGAWIREKRPGRRYVRAGITEDGKGLEYLDTDQANVKRVAELAAKKGTVHQPRVLPKPTRKHLAETIERAAVTGDSGTLKFLIDAHHEAQRVEAKQLKAKGR